MLRKTILLLGNCSHGACSGASAAADADFGIDGVNVSFLDGTGRAFAHAGSAGNASVG